MPRIRTALSAIVVSMLAVSPAVAGQASAQMSVGLTITGNASRPASVQAAASNTKIKKVTVTRDRISTITLTYY